MEDDIKKMETAAMAAYLKDVENNTRDMTADRIIEEKRTRGTTKDVRVFKCKPYQVRTIAEIRQQWNINMECCVFQFPQEIDPCDPTLSRSKGEYQHRIHQKSEGKPQGKGKSNKGKGKGKKAQEEDRPKKLPRTLWYEALSPEGYTYYWHIETNESVWEPPDEGYMTFAEQEEEAKEQAIQEQFLEQLEQEEAVVNVELLEEKRANAERERLRQLRKRSDSPEETENEQVADGTTKTIKEENRPYRRDYSIPEKSHPYGPWQTVRNVVTTPIDLQLPQQKQTQLPVFEKAEPPRPPQRIFKEKTITQINTGDSDEDGRPTAFKKRKIGNKCVRKRLNDD
ncbi:WW domain-binding protein 4 [Dufourea novaeangliae]|uniref:WW domain-binding protein 4 n=1 Tax=Dufourea novaeangliae TaxID=178035 RepID=A0A154PB44_DUFNO|nr:WW domain-binding protein 4 [Dufourea novaeangliae]